MLCARDAFIILVLFGRNFRRNECWSVTNNVTAQDLWHSWPSNYSESLVYTQTPNGNSGRFSEDTHENSVRKGLDQRLTSGDFIYTNAVSRRSTLCELFMWLISFWLIQSDRVMFYYLIFFFLISTETIWNSFCSWLLSSRIHLYAHCASDQLDAIVDLSPLFSSHIRLFDWRSPRCLLDEVWKNKQTEKTK